jgi:uncharacterized protein (DUF697 family)
VTHPDPSTPRPVAPPPDSTEAGASTPTAAAGEQTLPADAGGAPSPARTADDAELTEGSQAGDEALPDTVAQLTASDLDTDERKRLLRRVMSSAGDGTRRGLRQAVLGPRAAVRWATDAVVAFAPHVRARDLDTLRRHHGGRTGDALAEALVRNASRVTASIGVAGGGLAAIEWVAPPTLLSAPVLIAAETVAVVAVEVKLIAELHEAYGLPLEGSAAERGTQLLGAWAERRGVTLLHPARGFTTVLGVGLRKDLRDRLLRRMGRNLTTLGPILTGAAVAAELNRRATRQLGQLVRDDLRAMARQRPQLPPGH